MQFAVMTAAKRDSKLIAHFEADRFWLRKTQVMGIGRLSSADQTRLCSDEFQVRLVTQSFRFADRELAFVDWLSGRIDVGRHKRRSWCLIRSIVSSTFLQLFYEGRVLPTIVVARGPWNWSGVIRMKAKALH